MKETLVALVELQSLEDSLRDLRILERTLIQLREENGETREFFTSLLAERETQLGEVQAFCDETEKEIKTAEDNARRARARLNSIKSQRELTALNKELDTARRQNQQKTEELLKLMTQLESASADYAKKQQEFADLDQQMTDTEANTVRLIEEGKIDAHDQRARQAELRETLDRPILAQFDRILRGRDGRAVSWITDEICWACRMSVPPQIYQRILRMNSLETCHSCRRILVNKDGLVPPEAEVEPAAGDEAETESA